jgi:hypothetical protein
MADRLTQQNEHQVDVVAGSEQLELAQSALELNAKRQEALKARLNTLQSKLSQIDNTIVDMFNLRLTVDSEVLDRNRLKVLMRLNCPKPSRSSRT